MIFMTEKTLRKMYVQYILNIEYCYLRKVKNINKEMDKI